MSQDLRELSKSFKDVNEILAEAFEKQHPYEGAFNFSRFSWSSLKPIEQTWLFAMFQYMDAIVRGTDVLAVKVQELEKRIQDLESKAFFI